MHLQAGYDLETAARETADERDALPTVDWNNVAEPDGEPTLASRKRIRTAASAKPRRGVRQTA